MLRHLPCLECHHGRNQVKGLCICTKQIVCTDIRGKHAQRIYPSGYEDTKGHQSII